MVPLLSDAVAVACGYSHTAALSASGTVATWGVNSKGQLGDGTMTDRSTPVPVGSLSGATAVACGYAHTVAIGPGGTVWTWGRNDYGQLGDGTTTDRSTPGALGVLSGVVDVAVRNFHAAALDSEGQVWTWGWNIGGQLGDGTTTNRSTPAQVAGLIDMVAVACGESHTLALKADGTLWSWGYNSYGQLGSPHAGPVSPGILAKSSIGSAQNEISPLEDSSNLPLTPIGPPIATRPRRVGSLPDVVEIACGSYHSLAKSADGTVWTWGQNDYGQLGDGTWDNSAVPMPVLP
jgi:alpha-tubulin suppressor-like RCC1 family protein